MCKEHQNDSESEQPEQASDREQPVQQPAAPAADGADRAEQLRKRLEQADMKFESIRLLFKILHQDD